MGIHHPNRALFQPGDPNRPKKPSPYRLLSLSLFLFMFLLLSFSPFSVCVCVCARARTRVYVPSSLRVLRERVHQRALATGVISSRVSCQT